MPAIEVLGLPTVLFSHQYQAEEYQNALDEAPGFLEISYVVEGQFTLHVGKESYVASKGDVVCITHQKDTRVTALDFHCHRTVGMLVDWQNSKNQQTALLLPAITPAENGTEKICHIIDNLLHNQIDYKESKARGAYKCLELLCAIDRCNRKRQRSNLPGEQMYVERAKRYIQQNLQKTITQKSVAEYLGISREYLCAIFKKTEDITVMQYINRCKLENIRALMEHTQARLYEAASIYGYNDPNYVSRLYKKTFGYNITDKPTLPEQKG